MLSSHSFTTLAASGAVIGLLTATVATPPGRRMRQYLIISSAAVLVGLCEMLAANASLQRDGLLLGGVLLFLLIGMMAVRERMAVDAMRWNQALSDHSRAEIARSQAEERWQLMVQKTPLAFIELDASHRVLEWNAAATRLFGYEREEALGRPVAELVVPPAGREKLMGVLNKTLAEEAGEHHVNQNTTRDGKLLTCQWHNTRVRNRDGETVIYCIAHDITESTELETKLRHSQKLQSIGLLAAGVAHDFNNLLTVIQGHNDLLRVSLGGARTEREGALEREHCEAIAYAAEGAAALTRQLLSFSRQQAMLPVTLDLNELVERSTRMLARLVGDHVSIRLRLGGALPQIKGDANLLEQVITNLVVNARDAMPGGGTIRVSTATTRVSEERCRTTPGARPGQMVCLSVMDTGHGIPADKVDRIFEPFFTTKGVGKGTGLGLAAVHGIVEQHGGWIEVRSWPERGTIFSVFFQATAPAPTGATGNLPKPAPDPGRKPTISTFTVLVVEDEAVLRELCETILEAAGCRVILATDGNHALEQWEAYRDDIDVLFTDMMMPGGIGGYEVAQRLRRERPDLPVVFCSGYSPDTSNLGQLEGDGLIFLQKPYRQPALLEALRGALAHRSRRMPERGETPVDDGAERAAATSPRVVLIPE